MYVLDNKNIIYSFCYSLSGKNYYLYTNDSSKAVKDFDQKTSDGEAYYTKDVDYSEIKEIFDIDYFATLKNESCENGYFYVEFVSGDIISLFHFGERIPGWKQVDRNEYKKDVTASEIDKFYVRKTSYSIEEKIKRKNKIINEEYKEATLEEFLQAREMYDVKKI